MTDTGAGIAAENIEKMFKQFSQFNPDILQSGGGSGLGLWLSREIARHHGGDITVTSPGEGEGSTFSLHLPVYDNVNGAPIAEEQLEHSPPETEDSPVEVGKVPELPIDDSQIGAPIAEEQQQHPSAEAGDVDDEPYATSTADNVALRAAVPTVPTNQLTLLRYGYGPNSQAVVALKC